MLGPRHRLMLIRRDDVEHLVIVGPTSETVIERGIKHAGSFVSALASEEPKP
jgi:flagellar protein FliO/FliZ